jgi:AraC-like DNA-binding protein
MKLEKIDISYFKTSGFTSTTAENVKHVKILPYLSVVQSVEGSYDIALASQSAKQTGTGGFFIAPSGVQQTIVHHVDPSSGKMICRWLFLNAKVNGEHTLDTLYQFPTLVGKEYQEELNVLFDSLFSTKDLCDAYSCCYRIIGLLLRMASPSQSRFSTPIETAINFMMANYEKPISVRELAQKASMSESNFYAAFKRYVGSSPITYLNRFRLSLAAEKLAVSNEPINTISVSVGIRDALYFSKLFKRLYKVTPQQYRTMHQEK